MLEEQLDEHLTGHGVAVFLLVCSAEVCDRDTGSHSWHSCAFNCLHFPELRHCKNCGAEMRIPAGNTINTISFSDTVKQPRRARK